MGDRTITVRPHACSRGACLEKLLSQELGQGEVDFALCLAVVSHRDEVTALIWVLTLHVICTYKYAIYIPECMYPRGTLN